MNKLIIILIVAFTLFVLPLPFFAQDTELSVQAGRIGGSGLFAGDLAAGAFQGEILELTALHEPSGFGAEISPLAFRLASESEYSSVSLVNVMLFHRTFTVNQYSILGPFAAVSWGNLVDGSATFRGGIRFSWRMPWTMNDRELDHIAGFKPLFTILDVETGCLWQRKPAFYIAISVDPSVFAALGVMAMYGNAEKRAEQIRPEYKNPLNPERIPDPILVGPDHP